MNIFEYVVIAAACISVTLLKMRAVRMRLALRVIGVPVKARCVGINQDRKGRYTILLNYTNSADGVVYQFKEENYKTPPVRMGGELDALYDPTGQVPPTLASDHTRKKAFPFASCVAVPLLVAATIAFLGGF
ncbi:hypothetical protein [Streptomyces sp. PanSC9]|uniref:hypothetical protein n=1 Tax=Streptomyces sp. PanSC9 TaxID=1520461 RepID=UPI000F9A2197|nr:hypothetical protein [Streptomyces sp. PanSC9]ROP48038.1 hypothetical protein EDD94_7775 [Streptomyces sp. PanSC9]